jgi:membrane-associated phospholipid phosphatase
MIESLYNFDIALFLKIHKGLSNAFFDWLMPLLRNRFFWSPLYLYIIVFCFREYKKRGLYIIGGILLTFALGDMISSRLIKPFVARLRPCNDVNLANDIIHRVPCGSGYSFPSAHATNHFGIAIFLIMVFYPKWKPILPLGLAWAFMISFAQIYVGVHFPLDTIAGAALGTTVGFVVSAIFKKIQPPAL